MTTVEVVVGWSKCKNQSLEQFNFVQLLIIVFHSNSGSTIAIVQYESYKKNKIPYNVEVVLQVEPKVEKWRCKAYS